MNTAGNAYAAAPFDGSIRHNQRETRCGTARITRVFGHATEAQPLGADRGMRSRKMSTRGRTHSRSIPRRRTQPASKANVVFRPRPSCQCANPALSTYGHRPSSLSSIGRMLTHVAKIAAILITVAAIILAARTITRSVTQAAAVSQAEENVSLGVQETTDSLNESERQTLIDLLAASPADYASQVSAVLQGEEYPSGCEPAALACVLQSMGVDASLEDVIGYLDIDSEFIDFVYHYAGDPAGDGSAWPQAMVDTANRYLADAEDQAASFVALNISGASFDELKAIMAAGYPVMVWTTTYMEEPEFSDYEIFGYQFVINNHCVVAYGMSNDGENVLVMDSLEGLVERDAGDFATIYEERRCLAMVIAPAEASA